MAELPGFLTYSGIPLWRHAKIIQWVSQVVSGILVVALVAWFFSNMAGAIQEREIPYGFNFLTRAYQTPIGSHFIPYESSDTFLYAFWVAVVNTLVVSVVGVVLATALGIAVGVGRLSGNWLVSKASLVYVEFFRNVPLLVQLFFWFYIILALPPVRQGVRGRRGTVHQQRGYIHAVAGGKQHHRRGGMGRADPGGDCSGSDGPQGADAAGD